MYTKYLQKHNCNLQSLNQTKKLRTSLRPLLFPKFYISNIKYSCMLCLFMFIGANVFFLIISIIKNWPNLSMNRIQVKINEAKVHIWEIHRIILFSYSMKQYIIYINKIISLIVKWERSNIKIKNLDAYMPVYIITLLSNLYSKFQKLFFFCQNLGIKSGYNLKKDVTCVNCVYKWRHEA